MTSRTRAGRFAKGKSGNPTGSRPRKHTGSLEVRSDDWKNAITGSGDVAFDSRQSSTFEADLITSAAAQQLWQGDDLAARIIETRPNEMMRAGWDLEVGDEENGVAIREDVVTVLDDLGFDEALLEALYYESAFGGGAILIGANDGQKDLTKPLEVDRVTDLLYLNALSVEEITAHSWYTNPFSPNYNTPAIYSVSPAVSGLSYEPGADLNTHVHASRVIAFRGIQTGPLAANANGGWGDSRLVRVNRVLRDFNMSFASCATLLQDFAPLVFKIKGLAELLATDNNRTIRNRLEAVMLSRSTIRATIIDEAEELERKQTPVSGLAELLQMFFTRLAAAADMPLTLLAGQSPGGLNATGASDVRFFYDRVGAEQPKKLRKPIKYLARIVISMLAHTEPDSWGVRFHPLWQETAKEKAETRKLVAETDVLYIVNGVVSPEEIAASRFSGSEYNAETTIDFDLRDKDDAPVPEPVGKEEPEPAFGAMPIGAPVGTPAKKAPVELPEAPDKKQK